MYMEREEEEDVDMGGLFGDDDDDYGGCESYSAPEPVARARVMKAAAFNDDYGSEVGQMIADARNKAATTFTFEKLEKTAEYVETHYYKNVEGGVSNH